MISPHTGKRGRPLVFLGLVVLGWTGIRLTMGAVGLEGTEVSTSAGVLHAKGEALAQLDASANGTGSDVRSDSADRRDQEIPSDAQPSKLDERGSPGLDTPPPAHLVADPIPLPSASTHNSLWMSASQAETLEPVANRSEAAPDGIAD